MDSSRAVAGLSGPSPVVVMGWLGLFVKREQEKLTRPAHPAHAVRKGRYCRPTQHSMRLVQKRAKGVWEDYVIERVYGRPSRLLLASTLSDRSIIPKLANRAPESQLRCDVF